MPRGLLRHLSIALTHVRRVWLVAAVAIAVTLVSVVTVDVGPVLRRRASMLWGPRGVGKSSVVAQVAVDGVPVLHPGLQVALPTVRGVAGLVRELTAGWAVKPEIIEDAALKRGAFAAADVALAASGTVSLELAANGRPMVIAYDTQRGENRGSRARSADPTARTTESSHATWIGRSWWRKASARSARRSSASSASMHSGSSLRLPLVRTIARSPSPSSAGCGAISRWWSGE